MKNKPRELIKKCVKEIYKTFESWNEEDLKKAYNLLKMPQVEWWNRVLYWADLEPEKIEGKYYFKKYVNDEEVYCRFSGWIVDTGRRGVQQNLDFYRKTSHGLEKIGEVPKFGIEAEIRDLIKEKSLLKSKF